MQEHYEKESAFEEDLVNLLVEKKGWGDGVLMYPTEQDLIDNWARILFNNNNSRDRLNGAPLTSTEMDQVLRMVRQADTPFKANQLINGRSISVVRDSPDDPEHLGRPVYLTLFSREDVAGGTCSYQIARQPRFEARNPMLKDRRGDFMLLINGMPVIHVELKRSGVSWEKALHQIELYTYEHVFEGIFSLVQMFVCMTPEETRYLANPGRDGLGAARAFNRKFVFSWGDENNEKVREWHKVAERLLSIPMAHKMIAFYTVADSGDGNLKVLRSYQCHAVEAINRRLKQASGIWGAARPRGGFVWNTTGSGKTLTSFKAAQLAARSKLVDKAVFLVDRVELGDQSLSEYRGFADPRETVNDTDDSRELLSLLKDVSDSSKTLIVTSINKMAIVAKEAATERDLAALSRLRVAIIVDECHRSTFGEMMGRIKAALPMALFIGFTGTPITVRNSKGTSTTVDVFGEQLSKYTLADGIRDGNVLGFQLGKVETFSSDDLRKAVALEKARAADEEQAMADDAKRRRYLEYMDPERHPMAGWWEDGGRYHSGIEDCIPRAQYDNPVHREAVVRDIKARWAVVTQGGRLHGMLACSSIPEAMEYYWLVKREAPELKATCLYDPTLDNSEGDVVKEEWLVEVLEDYREMYGKPFTLREHAQFKQDLSMRLAHKRAYRNVANDPEERLDLLIVVDQMLTGYDSKWLGALFLDKVLDYERVIQAFSRTNRVLDADKTCGVVRYYRRVHTMDRDIAAAIELYSDGVPLGLVVSTVCENVERINSAAEAIMRVFEAAGVPGLSRLPEGDEARAMFCKEFNELSRALRAARVQGFTFAQAFYECDDFLTGEHQEAECFLSEETYEAMRLRYAELPRDGRGASGSDDVPYDIDATLATVDTVTVDRRYVDRFFQSFVESVNAGKSEEEVQAALDGLHSAYPHLPVEDQQVVERAVSAIWDGELEIHEGWECNDYVNHIRDQDFKAQLRAAASRFGVDPAKLEALVRLKPDEGQINEHGRFDDLMAGVDVARSKAALEAITGEKVKGKDVMRTVDAVMREFVFNNGCDVSEVVLRELS